MPSLIDLRRRIRAVKSTEQITKGPYDASSPSWSPDNKKIAYIADPVNGDYSRIRDIYVKPRGGEAYKITEGDSLIFSVAWSPKGDRLAYAGRKPADLEHPPYANTDISGSVISPNCSGANQRCTTGAVGLW